MAFYMSAPYIGDTVDVVAGSDLFVYLKGKWTESIEDALKKVVFIQRFPHTFDVTVQDGSKYDYEFDANGLIPKDSETLYEIGVGFACATNGVLVHVRLPANNYYNYLEKSGYYPSDDLSSHPYIGAFTSKQIPPHRYPKLLREYTIKNSEDRALRFYGDIGANEAVDKAVVSLDISKVHMIDPSEEEKKKVNDNWFNYISKGILNVIPGWRMANWYKR